MDWDQIAPWNMNQQTPSNKFGVYPTSKEIPYYQDLYSRLDPFCESINSKAAVDFIQRSGLPLAQLKRIWVLVLSSDSSVLVKEEFNVALRLIAYAQNGIEISKHSLSQNIPTKLPKISGIDLPAEDNFQKDFSQFTSQKELLELQKHKSVEEDFKLQTLEELLPPLVSSESQKPYFVFYDQLQHDISLETYNKLEEQYYTQDTQNIGHVQGQDFKLMSQKYQLCNDQLKFIWSLCDSDLKGYLLKGEFIIALHLIDLCTQGFKLPHDLQDNLLVVMKGQKVQIFIIFSLVHKLSYRVKQILKQFNKVSIRISRKDQMINFDICEKQKFIVFLLPKNERLCCVKLVKLYEFGLQKKNFALTIQKIKFLQNQLLTRNYVLRAKYVPYELQINS